MATKKPMKKPVKRVRRFQEGGEAALKAEGLAASNKTPMGFFERLRMGNIDQEGSEAYNRLGAGRGRMERDAASELAANQMVDNMNASRSARGSYAPEQLDAEAGDTARMSEMMSRGRAEGERDEKRMAPSLAQTQNAALLAAKPSRTASGKTTGDFTRLDRKALLPSGPNVKFAPGGDRKRSSASTEELAASLAAAKPTATTKEARQANIDQAFKPPSAENTQKGLEAGTLGAGLAGSAALAALLSGALYKGRKMYKAGQAAKEASRVGAQKRADLKEQAIDQINQVRKTDGRPALDTGAPMKSRSDLKQKTIDEINQNRKADGRPPLADDAMKRGGRVKKMASGGSVKSSVSSASRRGDGIAQRGKTRGKMY